MSENTLPKSLGLFRLTIYGIGTIIGSGIYAVISPAAASAGSGIWISFLIAALISSFTALSYSELASSMPSAGAEHSFLKSAFPKIPMIAFIVGIFIAIHGAATISAVALTFANYLNQFISINAILIAILLILIFTLTNIVGLKKASWINVSFTITQVICLIALIVAGLTSEGSSTQIQKVINEPINWPGALTGSAIVFFIYTGYEHMAALSEEAINPGKHLWKAFLLALVCTTVIYVGVIFAILSLVSPEEIAKSTGPLAFAAAKRWEFLGPLVTFAALLATANGVLSGSISVSRLLYGISRSGDLPKSLTKTTAKAKSPWFAAIIVMICACLLTFFGSLEFVASLSSFGALLVFVLINSAVIALRIKKPNLKRPLKIPGSIGPFPILPFFGAFTSLALATRYEPMVYLIFFAGVGLGILGYQIQKKK